MKTNNDTTPLTLEVRRIPFAYDTVSDPVWNRQRPEWSHMINGASLAMPYLEPFLIRTVREAMAHIECEQLKADVQGFISQEGQHFQNHSKYNEVLKACGYADLANVEDEMVEDYKRFQNKSLKWRLAYTAGFETMTIGVTEWLINQRAFLFGGADPTVTSLVLWHMVEETEHKNVALDLFYALYPRNYCMRIYGLLAGSFHLMLLSRKGYTRMLKRDGLWTRWTSRKRLYAMVGLFFWNVTPAMLRAVRPNYHPSTVEDPAWVQKWADAYAGLSENELPLLNTNDPEIPPYFVFAGTA